MTLSSYDWVHLSLAAFTATLTIFVTLSVSEQVRVSRGKSRQFWLTVGTITTGIGLWASYLLGLLALRFAVPFDLSPSLQAVVLLAAVGVIGIALPQLQGGAEGKISPYAGGPLVAAGSLVMFLFSVQSLGLPVSLTYNPIVLLIWGLVIGSSVSGAIQLVKRHDLLSVPRLRLKTLLSAGLGLTIVLMQHVGLLAMDLAPQAALVNVETVARIWMVTLPTLTTALVALGLTQLLASWAKQVGTFLITSAEQSPDLCIIIDHKWEIFFVSTKAAHLLGKPRRALLGLPAREAIPPQLMACLEGPVSSAMYQAETVTFDLTYDATGDSYEVTLYPWPDHITVFLRATTQRKALEEQIRFQASHDPLTGLANRTLFRSKVEQALSADETTEVAVLFLDLDDFKAINDTYGHTVGDSLLVAVAERITRCVRPVDMVCRMGGDEFAILLRQASLEAASVVANRILVKTSRPYRLQELQLTISPSIGIAVARVGSASADELLRNADLAMYRAKAEGTGLCRTFDVTMHQQARERLELKSQLGQAIANQELVLYYQPVVSAETGRVVCLEALVRWQHPTKGLLLPGSFIPLAEEAGLITHMTDWILEEACRATHDWQRRHSGASRLSVSVNLSVRDFDRGLIHERVAAVLGRTGLPAANLTLEVTESGTFRSGRSLTADFGALKELGVLLAIDDFGTGHSALSRLQKLPFDILKIDGSFVSAVGQNRKDTLLVEGIIHLARGLALKVVAEGIEQAEQLRALRDLGCDYAQGYYFAEPLPAAEVEQLLARSPFPAHVRSLPGAG